MWIIPLNWSAKLFYHLKPASNASILPFGLSYMPIWPPLPLCWEDFDLPVTMIACGPSGSGKTEPLTWIMRSGFEDFVRVDSFTPASFVTHAANVKKSDLAKIDLLPKLKNRCLCTKELAPLFAGREDELRSRFAQLTSVLDGEGLVTSSGSQGTRGYSERIRFAWLGATTPPSNKVFSLMAALGTRLFFFSTDFERPKASDYSSIISGRRGNADEKGICQSEVKDFLELFFNRFPIRSLPFDFITIPDHFSKSLGLLCDALTRLRGGGSLGEGQASDDDRYGAPAIEHGWRAARSLRPRQGSALIRAKNALGRKIMNLSGVFVSPPCLSIEG
jgi:hypothetical protein